MTITESLTFTYQGESSESYNIYNVQIDRGLTEELFVAERRIKEEKIRGRTKPYFQEIEKEPLKFPLTFFFDWQQDEEYAEDLIRATARWLTPDYYQPLIFSDNPDLIYFAIPVESSTLITNGLKEGFLRLTFRCNDAYAYSSEYTSEIHDCSSSPSEIGFTNDGDQPIFPEISIIKIGAGDLSIINISDDEKEFKFIDLVNDEEIYVDNENQIIITDLIDMYRYDNHNDVWLRMLRGFNELLVVGTASIQFRWRCKFLQG